MSTITINGRTYKGGSISIINNKVTIDGVVQNEAFPGNEVVRIEVTGDLASLKCDAPLVVTGDIKGDVEVDGPLTCGDIGGDVEADGPVTCGDVDGNVNANGPCTCGNVKGNVKADIICKS